MASRCFHRRRRLHISATDRVALSLPCCTAAMNRSNCSHSSAIVQQLPDTVFLRRTGSRSRATSNHSQIYHIKQWYSLSLRPRSGTRTICHFAAMVSLCILNELTPHLQNVSSTRKTLAAAWRATFYAWAMRIREMTRSRSSCDAGPLKTPRRHLEQWASRAQLHRAKRMPNTHGAKTGGRDT
ncbi:hypothetical protein shim_06230 [Shimia sp. SK013]|nr:hypothetical protein shim_06230 [Shimia sp. SK013]